MQCTLRPNPGMAAPERRALIAAFEQARIHLADEAALVVHAVEPLSMLSAQGPSAARATRPTVLRVRGRSGGPPGPMAWAREVTVELAAWMLVTPPPPGTELDVVVPATTLGAAPKLARPHGLMDTRHVTFIAHERGVAPARRSQVQEWAKALVQAMTLRWSPAGAPCGCC